MKKVLSLILALAMVFALVACGEKQPASDGDASSDGDKPARGNVIMTFGTADTAASCDYLGLVSGNAVADKVAKSGFTAVKSEFVDAPVMTELPLALECKLVSMNEENCDVVGRIVNCAVEESALTDGKPDAAKMRPICFDACQHVYRLMGETVAKAFSCGKALKG